MKLSMIVVIGDGGAMITIDATVKKYLYIKINY